MKLELGMDEKEEPLESEAFVPRGYQIEMLEASLAGNIIVAMDTGSGKTPIAVMRIEAEVERSPSKRVWFLCPKVALAQQQCRVVHRQLPAVLCKVLVGSDGCEYWGTQTIWDEVLLNVQVVVCTPEILYDALCHGFVRMTEISLLIFDEAHYCKDKHPANRILSYFYHPARQDGLEIPYILGLTASPVFGNEVSGLVTIEKNLNSICRTPRLNREELLRYTHCPALVQLAYDEIVLAKPQVLTDLEQAYHKLNIYDDPYLKHLQANETPEEDIRGVILRGRTNCRDQIRTLIDAANKILGELGPWAAEWYTFYCIESFQDQRTEKLLYVDTLAQEELIFLLAFFKKLDCSRGYTAEPPNIQTISPKVKVLADILLEELESSKATDVSLTGIVFVETRIAVCVLKQLLEHSPWFDKQLRLGLSFGTSTNPNRKKLICDCIMSDKSIEDIEIVLGDLRTGKKNLLVSTNVVEEGIDITACNTIICFSQPPNLVSFVQRRGRARDARSKYFIMFPSNQVATGVSKWTELEEQMKKKYMDDMREISRLEGLEMTENASRTYRVESTGAQLQLDDALQHLNHFCNTLGDVRYASTKPVFVFKPHESGHLVKCEVVLPNVVDSQFRRFCSSKYWISERSAKNDAAFEACVALHKNGLLNDHLLPIKSLSEEEASMYQILGKRPNVVAVLEEYNPWIDIAKLSLESKNFTQQDVVIREGSRVRFRMRFIMPGMPKFMRTFNLYIDRSTTYDVSFENQRSADSVTVSDAGLFTRIMLHSMFRRGMDPQRSLLPILFLPERDSPETEVNYANADLGLSKILDHDAVNDDMGLLRDVNDSAHMFRGFESVEVANHEIDGPETLVKVMAKTSKISKRTDFLHALSAGSAAKQDNSLYLDPEITRVNSLPSRFSLFARFVPCIQHKIRICLLVEQFQRTILESASISSPDAILEAISAPMARESVNYQRMEFLGDTILKYYTTVTLMAENLTYPEGYLAQIKDLVVSNKSAALAAKEISLDRFIIRTAFTGAKWRPVYMDETEIPYSQCLKDPPTELSTKILADVVEALIAAAYLDGTETESKVLAMLNIFTCSAVRNKIKWQPLGKLLDILINATPEPRHVPELVLHLQRMIGYTFHRPGLAIEALTHPGYISLPSIDMTGGASYQRLEFLGDAVLEMIVTRTIYGFEKPIPVFRMHLLRTAAVNQDILGYLAIRLKTDIKTSRLVKNVTSAGQKRDRDSNTRNLPSKLPETFLQSISLLQLLRHSPDPRLSSDLADMHRRCHELSDRLDEAFETGSVYPWVLLAELSLEKLPSDLVEAVLGAIYIDSHGDLDVCEAWIEQLGILTWLRRAMKEDVKVWHPKEELGVLADTESVHYFLQQNVEQAGSFVCTISVGDRELCAMAGSTRKIAETRAAALAVQMLSQERIALTQESSTVEEVREEVEEVEIED